MKVQLLNHTCRFNQNIQRIFTWQKFIRLIFWPNPVELIFKITILAQYIYDMKSFCVEFSSTTQPPHFTHAQAHTRMHTHTRVRTHTIHTHTYTHTLKLVSAIFYQIYIFSANDSPSKTVKNVFYFIEKALFVLEIFKFLWFFPFLSTLSILKRTNESGIIYDVMNWLA